MYFGYVGDTFGVFPNGKESIMISSRSFSSDTHREKIVRNQETKMQVLCIKREKEREKRKSTDWPVWSAVSTRQSAIDLKTVNKFFLPAKVGIWCFNNDGFQNPDLCRQKEFVYSLKISRWLTRRSSWSDWPISAFPPLFSFSLFFFSFFLSLDT